MSEGGFLRRHSKAEAQKLIREILSEVINVLSGGRHFNQELKAYGAQMRDVLNCLKKGMIYEEPEPHPKTNYWTYRVKGKTIEGDDLTVVINIHAEEQKIVLITVF